MPVRVRVVEPRLDRLLRNTGKTGVVGSHVFQLGVRVSNRAKERCPVDTGRLRSSIGVTQPLSLGGRRLVVRVGTNVRYAVFVHEGTRYMRARPFLREALNEVMQ